MKLPRDVSGEELVRLLRRYDYVIVRTSGSHIRLTSNLKGSEHHVTIPDHDPIKVGTLSDILSDVADYLAVERSVVVRELFG